MSDKTGIEWADASWPVITGCTHISDGCDNCYAANLTSTRLRHLPEYAGLAENGRFNGTVRCLPDRLDWPLHWRKPRRIFVSDMADLFHPDVPDLFITEVFDVMEQAPQHTFQVPTKRHARMRSFVRRRMENRAEYAAKFDDCPTGAMRNSPAAQWARKRAVTPQPNIWLGVSAENQKWADIRIPALLDTPTAVRFVSAEPLLGPINLHANDNGLHNWLPDYGPQYDDGTGDAVCQAHGISHCRQGCNFVDWLIVGGESGQGARKMDLAWAQSLIHQCENADVPVFMKQVGSVAAPSLGPFAGRKGGNWDAFPDGLRVRQFPRVAKAVAS